MKEPINNDTSVQTKPFDWKIYFVFEMEQTDLYTNH